jgi:hypothetical protein
MSTKPNFDDARADEPKPATEAGSPPSPGLRAPASAAEGSTAARVSLRPTSVTVVAAGRCRRGRGGTRPEERAFVADHASDPGAFPRASGTCASSRLPRS